MAEYIDREKAKRTLVQDYAYAAANLLDEVPKADVAPLVHGLWDEWYPPKHMILTGEEMLYRCSSCDAKYSDVEGFRFCPHCGARMDFEVSNGKSETVWYAPQGDSE